MVAALAQRAVLPDCDVAELAAHPVRSAVDAVVEQDPRADARADVDKEECVEVPSGAITLLRKGHAAHRVVHDGIRARGIPQERGKVDVLPARNAGAIEHDAVACIDKPRNACADAHEGPAVGRGAEVLHLSHGRGDALLQHDRAVRVRVELLPVKTAAAEAYRLHLEGFRLDPDADCVPMLAVEVEEGGLAAPAASRIRLPFQYQAFRDELVHKPLRSRDAELADEGKLDTGKRGLVPECVEDDALVALRVSDMAQAEVFYASLPRPAVKCKPN